MRAASPPFQLTYTEALYRRLIEQVPVVTYICDYDEAASMRYVSPADRDRRDRRSR